MEKETIKSAADKFVLKQLDSIANFRMCLRDILLDEAVLNNLEYYYIQIRATYNFRNNYLRSIGVLMSEEEKAFWKMMEELYSQEKHSL